MSQSGHLIQFSFVSSFPCLFPNTCHFHRSLAHSHALSNSTWVRMGPWCVSWQPQLSDAHLSPLGWVLLRWGELILLHDMGHKGQHKFPRLPGQYSSLTSSLSAGHSGYKLWASWAIFLALLFLASEHVPNNHVYHPSHCIQGCGGKCRGALHPPPISTAFYLPCRNRAPQ